MEGRTSLIVKTSFSPGTELLAGEKTRKDNLPLTSVTEDRSLKNIFSVFQNITRLTV